MFRMTSFHKSVSTAKKDQEEKKNTAVSKLEQFLLERRGARQPVDDLQEFERELHSLFATAEAEVVGHEVERFDIDLPFVTVDGIVHQRVLRCEDTLLLCVRSGAGDAELVFDSQGVREGDLSDGAASGTGGRALDTACGETSDVGRMPAEAVSMAVSLDGVMVPMKNGGRQAKRAQAAEEGKYRRGPAGNKEVGCGTLSFYDEEGERLATIRMARMPEVKKATLKVTLSKEVNSCLAERPDLKVVKVADGAKDNWTFLSGELPDGEEVIDFYHAAGHLDTALAVAYGDTHPKRSAQFKKLRHVLLEDDKGVEKVIRSLVHLRDTYPRRKKIARELKYFRRNRHRMRYAVLKKQGLPIGSGVTEAACKTLATQRLKRSGMRWGEQGEQAILSFRALVQSNRFERAWTLLAQTYKAEVTTLDNVVPIRS